MNFQTRDHQLPPKILVLQKQGSSARDFNKAERQQIERIDCIHIEFISCQASDCKKFELKRRMSPDSATLFILFYQYDFVVGLLQGFMKKAHESGSNSPGAGTFSRDLTKTKSLQCRDFTRALRMEKSISRLFPGPRGRDCKDWCIISVLFAIISHADTIP